MRCAVLVVFLVFVVLPAWSTTCPDLTAAPTVDVGNFLWNVVTADFNSDGKRDAAVASSVPSSGVAILLGDGAGSLGAPFIVPVGGNVDAIATADFNGDGDVDLAASGGSDSVSVLLGNGDGTFAAAVPYVYTANAGGISSVVARDLDGDGDPDLAVVAQIDMTVVVLFNDGAGAFANPTPYGAGPFAMSLIADDFNGDGAIDLAAGSGPAIYVLLNEGSGTFGSALVHAAPSDVFALASGDFDADGDKDLVYGLRPGAATILLGNGDGTFAGGTALYTGAVSAFAVGHVNRDNKLDVVVLDDIAQRVGVYRGAGNGTFTAAGSYVAASNPAFVAIADLDADGSADLVVANQMSDDVSILLNDGTGAFEAPPHGTVNVQALAAPALADFNGDGFIDVAIGSAAGSNIAISLGDSFGAFVTPAYFSMGTFPMALTTGDYNADGHADVASANAGSSNITVRLGNGSGSFGSPTSYGVGGEPYSIVSADLNGDLKVDLAVSNRVGNTVSVLLGNGDGTFAAHVQYAVGLNPTSVVAADFNGDGKLDLATANGGNDRVSILIGSGTGTFAAAVHYLLTGPPVSLAAANLGGSAAMDLVAGREDNMLFTVLVNNGDGTFAEPVDVESGGFYPLSVTAADLDADGLTDVIAANSADRTLAVVRNLGGGSFAPPILYATAGEARIGAGDPDDDGKPDVIVAANASGMTVLTTYVNRRVTPVRIGSVRSAPAGTTGVVATVTARPGSTYAWAATGGTITAGQGTPSVVLTLGAAGTRTRVSVVETAAASCTRIATKSILGDFNDVPPTHPFYDFVARLANNGITGGCGGGFYCVNDPVLRSQMAIFLIRGIEGEGFVPAPATGVFDDVPPGSFGADWIEALHGSGITGGCAADPLRYCPNNPVLRSQMAIFLLRAKYGSSYAPPPATGIFADVPIGSFGAAFIEQLYREGITGGCAAAPLRYCPSDTTTRGQMAVFLTRTFNLQ